MTDKDIKFLELQGWVVECESPLEIRDRETDSFATGYAATIVLDYLREEIIEADLNSLVFNKFNINA